MAATSPQPAEGGTAETWATLFIDLLGWSTKLLEYDQVHRYRDDGARVSKTITDPIQDHELARVAIEGVLEGKKAANDTEEHQSHVAALKGDDRDLFEAITAYPFVLRLFGDSFVLNFPCGSDPRFGDAVAAGRLHALLHQAGFMMVVLLATGVPLRGGAEIGVGTEYTPRGKPGKELVSASIAKAYRLEHEIANYPRIVVGRDLVGYLSWIAGKPQGTTAARLAAAAAKSALSLCRTEADGSVSLDFLSPNIIGAQGLTGRETADRAFAFVRSQFFEAQARHDAKLVGRYGLAMHYFLERLGPPAPPKDAAPSP